MPRLRLDPDRILTRGERAIGDDLRDKVIWGAVARIVLALRAGLATAIQDGP